MSHLATIRDFRLQTLIRRCMLDIAMRSKQLCFNFIIAILSLFRHIPESFVPTLGLSTAETYRSMSTVGSSQWKCKV